MFSSSCSVLHQLFFISLTFVAIPCIHNITIAATSFHRLHPSKCVHQWINVKLETSKLSPNELSCCIKKSFPLMVLMDGWLQKWKIFLLYGETKKKIQKTCRHDFRDFQSYFEEFYESFSSQWHSTSILMILHFIA